MLGWSEKERVGSTAELIFTPEDRLAQVPQREIREALETGRATDERWHVRKDGSRFWASGVMATDVRSVRSGDRAREDHARQHRDQGHRGPAQGGDGRG